jgi:hypothetical protein
LSLDEYLKGRRLAIESSIAAEKLAGNEWKEVCEKAALAEITALECEQSRLKEVASPDPVGQLIHDIGAALFATVSNYLRENPDVSKYDFAYFIGKLHGDLLVRRLPKATRVKMNAPDP